LRPGTGILEGLGRVILRPMLLALILMYLLQIPIVIILSTMLARHGSMRSSVVSMVERLTAQLSASS